MSLCKRHATFLLSLLGAACSTTGTIDLPGVEEESLACVAPLIDDLEAYDSSVTLRTHDEAVALCREIVEKGNSKELRTAWALAAHCPSPDMAKVASKRLARFSVWHPTDQLFVEVADAIVA